jgi:hypothetical protein
MKTMKTMLLIALVSVLAALCLVGCAAREGKPQGEPETRPTLYYQGQKYDLLHSESNKIDVSGLLYKKDGTLGEMRYPGAILHEDLDVSDARRAGDTVYPHPERENALIYQCSDCGEFFCITPEFMPLESVVEIEDPIPDTMDPNGSPAPGLQYRWYWYRMDHYDGNRISVAGKKLEYIGVTRYCGGKVSQDLDVTYDHLAGYSVYIDPAQPDALIYFCIDCDEYFSISHE